MVVEILCYFRVGLHKIFLVALGFLKERQMSSLLKEIPVPVWEECDTRKIGMSVSL